MDHGINQYALGVTWLQGMSLGVLPRDIPCNQVHGLVKWQEHTGSRVARVSVFFRAFRGGHFPP